MRKGGEIRLRMGETKRPKWAIGSFDTTSRGLGGGVVEQGKGKSTLKKYLEGDSSDRVVQECSTISCFRCLKWKLPASVIGKGERGTRSQEKKVGEKGPKKG